MGVNSLAKPKTVTRQRRDCDLNPGPSAPESSTLTTRLPSHPLDTMGSLLRYSTSYTAIRGKRGVVKGIDETGGETTADGEGWGGGEKEGDPGSVSTPLGWRRGVVVSGVRQ